MRVSERVNKGVSKRVRVGVSETLGECSGSEGKDGSHSDRDINWSPGGDSDSDSFDDEFVRSSRF